MAKLASGVCVVTTIDSRGVPWGFTASSVVSVSLRPPMLLCCLARSARAHEVFTAAPRLAVSILGADQEPLAVTFASPRLDRFSGSGFTQAPSGTPVNPNALAWLDCRLDRAIDAGDHTILLAAVEQAWSHTGRPLIYFDRHYRNLLLGTDT